MFFMLAFGDAKFTQTFVESQNLKGFPQRVANLTASKGEINGNEKGCLELKNFTQNKTLKVRKPQKKMSIESTRRLI